jgi:hypothetical protein
MRDAFSIAPLAAVLLVAFAAKFEHAMMAAVTEPPAAVTTVIDSAESGGSSSPGSIPARMESPSARG